MNKTRIAVVLPIFILLPNLVLLAQEFREMKWGMTRQQVKDTEKEAHLSSEQDDYILYEIDSRSETYSSLSIFYHFNNGSDSLTWIALTYNDATGKLYDNLVRINDYKYGKSITIDDTRYWKSKDNSTIEYVWIAEKYVGTIITSQDEKGLKSIDFKKKTVKNKPKPLTYSSYSNLTDGMTYLMVVQILGSEGKELSRSSFANIVTVIYQWQNDDGSNIVAMFQNYKLVSKSQIGLK